MSTLPIADYALLSDCHSAALVSRDGSIDWFCPSRFDAPSLFARLLDDDAGHWIIRPAGDAHLASRRRYLDGSLVLETTFTTATGSATLTDALAVGATERGHGLGAAAVHTILRRVAGVTGTVEFGTEYAPRPDYGVVTPRLERSDGIIAARAGASTFALSSSAHLEINGGTASGRFTVGAGESASFALQQGDAGAAAPRRWTEHEIGRRLDETTAAWGTWSALHQNYQGPWADLVHQSGRVLYGLTYFPTGAMVAAPTTSLPEVAGGARNWDYRYAWVRDASFTLQALWVAACPHEANKFFDYLAGAAASEPLGRDAELQIMFGVGGERELTERVLAHLTGWRGSAPVRVGNGAWDQRQLDVYGELLDAAYRLPKAVDRLGPATRQFLVGLADIAARRWREPDQGIWEVRGGPQQFVYSKLMCWVGLDRAIALADRLDALDRVEAWSAARDDIADSIVTRGWNPDIGAFTQTFGGNELDACSLMVPIVGFLPATDPRVRATIDAVATHLTDDRGLVYRYRAEDGLEGEEGTFLLCTFWLSHAQALAGDLAAARATFENAVRYVNDLGLLSEEVDAATGELLGNYPQAFSHIGLVNAAWAIAEAEAARPDPEGPRS